jgi:hypothetical protein
LDVVVSVESTLSRLWERAKEAEARPASFVETPFGKADEAGEDSEAQRLESGDDYFQVVLNEIHLKREREWFTTYDPLVFVVSEFSYAREQQAVPFLVGPTLFEEKYGRKVPLGAVLEDTRVAGLHPFRGGRFALALMLYSVERQNYAREVLSLVERASGLLKLALPLDTPLKVAELALDGFEFLLGLQETRAIAGRRVEFGGQHTPLRQGYFALIDADVPSDSVVVKSGRLKHAATEEPYRDADYVLCSIERISDDRDDVDSLPFAPLWDRVAADAIRPTPEAWESAKGNMLTLAQTLFESPDLTEAQAERLVGDYQERMNQRRKIGKGIAKQAAGDRDGDADKARIARQDEVRRKTVDILKLPG